MTEYEFELYLHVRKEDDREKLVQLANQHWYNRVNELGEDEREVSCNWLGLVRSIFLCSDSVACGDAMGRNFLSGGAEVSGNYWNVVLYSYGEGFSNNTFEWLSRVCSCDAVRVVVGEDSETTVEDLGSDYCLEWSKQYIMCMRDIILSLLLSIYIAYIKYKKSEDLSVASWVLWIIASCADSLYSVLLGRVELIIASLLNFVLIGLVFVLIIYHRKNRTVV